MSRRIWVYLFPLLFLPNLAGTFDTQFGTIEMADWLIVPYLLFVLWAANFRIRIAVDKVKPLMISFLIWAFIVTISINLRYGYDDYHATENGILKLAKFLLYGFAGYVTIKCLDSESARKRFTNSLIAAVLVLGIGAILVGSKSEQRLAERAGTDFTGYKASNAISVYLGMMASYLAGFWSRRKSMPKGKRYVTLVGMGIALLGSAATEGRGGWVAAIFGLAYVLIKGGTRRQILALGVAIPILVTSAYYAIPVFQHRVYVTFNPTGGDQTDGIDNGARFEEWRAGIRQFADAPLLGTGFFHRGGYTSLYATGSHNFFLQMFLETGLPGGILILMIFRSLWKEAGSAGSKRIGSDVPTRAMIIAAAAGAMSGEYFYGSVGLLALFSLYGLCGSVPIYAGSPRDPDAYIIQQNLHAPSPSPH
jgi:O-antigen ligase